MYRMASHFTDIFFAVFGTVNIRNHIHCFFSADADDGDAAFPGNGSPKVDKDYEIVNLRKKVEELERENELLKNFRAFLSQDHARGAGSSRRIGANSAPSGRLARFSTFPNPSTTTT